MFKTRVSCGPRLICGRTSRGHTGGRLLRISHHLPLAVLALIFIARRIQPFLSHVDREVEFLCTHEIAGRPGSSEVPCNL